MPTRRNGSQSNVIAQHLFAACLMLMPITVCWGQQRGGVDREVATPLIMSVLSEAKLSGSLEYWGRCDNVSGVPDYPRLRAPRNDGGTLALPEADAERWTTSNASSGEHSGSRLRCGMTNGGRYNQRAISKNNGDDYELRTLSDRRQWPVRKLFPTSGRSSH
jgi:hypothetical protein